MSKIDYERTPDGYQRILDANLKIEKALVIPVFTGTPSINDNPNEKGYIGLNSSNQLIVYDGTNWNVVNGTILPTGGTTLQYLRGDLTWQTLPIAPVYTASNGITKTGNNFTLGGTIPNSGTVFSIGNTAYMSFSGSNSSSLISSQVSASNINWNIASFVNPTSASLQVLPDSVTLFTSNEPLSTILYKKIALSASIAGSGIVVNDDIDNLGFVYRTDYSASWSSSTPNAIPSVSWILSYISSGISGYLPLSGGTLTGDVQQSTSPVNANSLINKSYVDNLITGITWKQEVIAATTANITLSGTQTIDGIALAITNRVLVKNQSSAIDNGIYIVASGAWTRSIDADISSEIGSATVLVRKGTLQNNTQWTCTNSTDPVIGTDAITFGQIAGAGTYTNGTGIVLTGNVFALDTSYSNSLYPQLSGSYTNPSWINSLPYSKITGTPSLSGYEVTSNKVTTLDNSTTNYPSTSAVTTAIATKQSNNQFYGSLYNKNSWSTLTDFTNNGANISVVSNKLLFSGNGSGNTYLVSEDINYYTCLDHWEIYTNILVTSKTSTSYGIGVGIRSYSYGTKISNFAWFDASTDANSGTVSVVASGTILATSTALTWTAGDYISISCERVFNVLIATARNVTTNSSPVTISYTLTPTTGSNPQLANTGKFAIFDSGASGNTFTVDSLTVYSKSLTTSNLMLVGDSKTTGYGATTFNNAFSYLLQNNVFSLNINAGASDWTQDVINRLPEIVALKPTQIILCIGYNDIAGSGTSWQANISTIYSTLTAAGINVIFLNSIYDNYSGLNSSNTLANYINITYPSNIVIDTYDPGDNQPNTVSSDNIHPSNIGHALVYNTIINSGKLLNGFNLQDAVNKVVSSSTNITGTTLAIGGTLASNATSSLYGSVKIAAANAQNFNTNSNYDYLQIGKSAFISSLNNTANSTSINNNAYFGTGGAYLYGQTGYAQSIYLSGGDGSIQFQTFPSGISGAAATPTTRLSIANTGAVSVAGTFASNGLTGTTASFSGTLASGGALVSNAKQSFYGNSYFGYANTNNLSLSTSYDAIGLGQYLILQSENNGSGLTLLQHNVYQNSSNANTYINNGSASEISMVSTGDIKFFAAPSGIAGATATLTNYFSVGNSGVFLPQLTTNSLLKTSGGNGNIVLAVANTDYLPVASPVMTTPTLGVASATSINKVTITAPTTSATLTLVTGSSLITSGAFATTLTATGTTNVTLPTSGTLDVAVTTTLGDISYGGVSGVKTRLAGNTTSVKQFLTQTGTGTVSAAPSWGALVAGDIPSLSAYYIPIAQLPIKGNSTTTGTATTSVTVTIGTTMATSSYNVGITPRDLLTAINWYISAQTSTTFTVTFVSGITGSINFDWIINP